MIKLNKLFAYIIIFCLFLNLTSCSEENNIKSNSGKILKEYGENVYNALVAHDTEALKSMFCEELQNNYDLDSDIEAVYEFLGGNIQGYDHIECDTHGESVRDGKTVRLTSYAEINELKTDNGTFYITINIMLIYKDAPSYVGIQNIYIRNSKYDPFAEDKEDNKREIADVLEGW